MQVFKIYKKVKKKQKKKQTLPPKLKAFEGRSFLFTPKEMNPLFKTVALS